jgi:hypothetical protein
MGRIGKSIGTPSYHPPMAGSESQNLKVESCVTWSVDYFVGGWTTKQRRLKATGVGSADWEESSADGQLKR